MKVLLTIIVSVLISFSWLGCSKKSVPAVSAEVNFLSENDGTVTVRAIGTGNSDGAAAANAILNSFDVLFFRGLPESKQKSPLIGTNETEERNKNKSYFDNFYTSRYQTFVMSQVAAGNAVNLKGGQKSITLDVKINLVSLRNDLEQNNIIRKFGF